MLIFMQKSSSVSKIAPHTTPSQQLYLFSLSRSRLAFFYLPILRPTRLAVSCLSRGICVSQLSLPIRHCHRTFCVGEDLSVGRVEIRLLAETHFFG
ncbi:hypothetical protein CH063_05830 [Colletotrichum higginsianum]|uniref:Uncharacterized protein n=1 Tax=Colletotrichum higginsianum (strain IMI 349063) TaxID=759273 RepID=H1V0D5_COLHI|nr:hypothetical protein CH063_05830 [Colletotrichum higginsianum]